MDQPSTSVHEPLKSWKCNREWRESGASGWGAIELWGQIEAVDALVTDEYLAFVAATR
jgi:hypothetical protein